MRLLAGAWLLMVCAAWANRGVSRMMTNQNPVLVASVGMTDDFLRMLPKKTRRESGGDFVEVRC